MAEAEQNKVTVFSRFRRLAQEFNEIGTIKCPSAMSRQLKPALIYTRRATSPLLADEHPQVVTERKAVEEPEAFHGEAAFFDNPPQ